MLQATDVKNFVCVCCPMGCQLEVGFDDKGSVTSVTGYTCNRGKAYAREEATDPRRMVTAVICIKDCPEPLSVKTAQAIPKRFIDAALTSIRSLDLTAPISAGDVLIKDVAHTGVSVIATKSLDAML
ncbi:MAG: DUF1667 domain-containing protein [Eggerthellaceae bacterium]|nr:DUF1667 domain-containing protein [Eggerthellaceae bacterium]MCH4220387.1 DUF1667 domain-containing protein [Eggerthellaceae bacterium]